MGLTAKKVYALLNKKINKVSSDVLHVGTPLKYSGNVQNESGLPANPEIGSVCNIKEVSTYGPAGTNVAWNGKKWNAIGPVMDMDGVATLLAPEINQEGTLVFGGSK